MKLIELLNSCVEKSLPFYSYRLPYDNNNYTGIQLESRHVTTTSVISTNQRGFIVSPFYNTKDSFHIIQPDVCFVNQEFDINIINQIAGLPNAFQTENITVVETEKDAYISQAENLIELINQNKFRKIVLSRTQKSINFKKSNAADAFFQLVNKYPHAFISIFYLPEFGLWLGATPETLVRHNQFKTETVSLAATKAAIDLRPWTEKEIDEQQVVSEFVLDVLQQFPFENIDVKNTTEISAGAITHLLTEFTCTGEINDEQLTSLILKLHPTPAVCGIPKQEALTEIVKTEMHDRELYAGFIGPTGDGCAQLFVNLRCMKLTENESVLYAGGGLTALSQPESEWLETCMKLETLTNAIKIIK